MTTQDAYHQEPNEALKATENTLRDFIAEVLSEKLGEDWLKKCGVTPERIERWKQRQEEERKKIRGRGIEERILYYADFYDLPVILEKHWKLFEPCFGKWKTMDVYLDKLESFRNPEAHRRELFPQEIHLVLGITGEIRTSVTYFRSAKKPENKFFPILEQVVDSLGNTATPQQKHVDTKKTLHPGDSVSFIATAWDPKGEACEFRLWKAPDFKEFVGWTRDRVLEWKVTEEDIRNIQRIYISLRSLRKYHASGDEDDMMAFDYMVLPKE